MARQQFTHFTLPIYVVKSKSGNNSYWKNTSELNGYLSILLLIPGQFIIFFIYRGCSRTTTFQSVVINKDTADIYIYIHHNIRNETLNQFQYRIYSGKGDLPNADIFYFLWRVFYGEGGVKRNKFSRPSESDNLSGIMMRKLTHCRTSINY